MSAIAEQLKIYLNRIQEGKARGMWQVGCYLFTDSENVTSHIQLKSILSGEASRIEPIRIHDISKYSTHGNKKTVAPFTTPPELYIEKKSDSDHNEFKHPDYELISKKMKKPVIFDTKDIIHRVPDDVTLYNYGNLYTI